MKVWYSRDSGDGWRRIFITKPTYIAHNGRFITHRGCEIWDNNTYGIGTFFPKGVKKGQCVKCTLNRLEVDDG